MTKVDFSIEDLIPHRDGMKLIDTIIDVDGNHAVAEATVLDRWPLCENGMASWIVFGELIAETVGLAAGLETRIKIGKPSFGYLVGIKKSKFFAREVKVGTLLRITADFVHKVQGYGLFRGALYENETLLCEMDIQVFSPGEDQGNFFKNE